MPGGGNFTVIAGTVNLVIVRARSFKVAVVSVMNWVLFGTGTVLLTTS